MKELKHLIRYGTAQDTQFIKKHSKSFDFVVLNANLLCHHIENMSRTIYVDFKNIEYFIEPKLYTFQNDLKYIKNKDNKIKKSYKTLANEYDLSYIIERDEHLEVEELTAKKIEELTINILNFQKNWVYDNLSDELKRFSEITNFKKDPSFLVIPSLFMKSKNDLDWHSINLKFIERSLFYKKEFNHLDMYATMIIGKEILNNKSLIDMFINEYSIADGLLLWIDNFNDLSEDKETIESLIYLVKTYKENNPNKDIISLYGGYFQELLTHIGLDGVCHSVAYGESKEVCSLGGAPVVQKYYMPNLFQRMKPETMIKLLHNLQLKTKHEFYEKVCDCNVCKEKINTDSIHNKFLAFLDALDDGTISRNNARINCIEHYLKVKCIEYNNVSGNNFFILIEQLKEIYDKYVSSKYIDSHEIYYLMKWYECLKDSK